LKRIAFQLNRKNFDKALSVADRNGLEKDPIYQALWLDGDVSLTSVRDHLVGSGFS